MDKDPFGPRQLINHLNLPARWDDPSFVLWYAFGGAVLKKDTLVLVNSIGIQKESCPLTLGILGTLNFRHL